MEPISQDFTILPHYTLQNLILTKTQQHLFYIYPLLL